MIENEKSKALSRREEIQGKSENLKAVNAKQYDKENIIDFKKQDIIIQTSGGKRKNKKVELTTYKRKGSNCRGVVKSRLVSVIKGK